MKFSANPSVGNPAPPGVAKSTNLAGGTAYTQDPRHELASLVLTSMLKDKFYAKGADDIERAKLLVAQLAASADGAFVAKAALYARHVHGLRSISHVLAGELAQKAIVADWRRKFFAKVVQRPDDACEIIAYVRATMPKRLPNALTRGIAKALEGFNGYQLAKYAGGSRELSLIDVVNLTHPRGKENSPLAHLMKGTLKPADTWESALSKAGQVEAKEGQAKETAVAEAKKQEWERLLLTGNLGYLAMLRNLRNIIEQAPEAIDRVLVRLRDAEQVKRSRIFPFQFLAAFDALESVPPSKVLNLVLNALVDAVDLALGNVPVLAGSTLVVVDKSGSMSGQPIKIAALFAATLLRSCEDADLMFFADRAVYTKVLKKSPVMVIGTGIVNADFGGGTNFHVIFDSATRKYDRVVILSDMQGWMGDDTPNSTLHRYKQRTSSDPFVYAFDLQGHGTSQFEGKRILHLAGWSEKVFDVMAMLEQDRGALVAEIDKIEL
jgi:60 kDa SS-A/Ro ribonucleoprotein